MTDTVNFAAGQAALLAHLRRQEAQLAAMNATIGNLEARLTGLEDRLQTTQSLHERRRRAYEGGYRTEVLGENGDGERLWALWDLTTCQWVWKGKRPAEFATEADALSYAESLQ